MRKLFLYIATSLDGYIAKPNDDLSFLSIVEKDGEDYGYKDFVATVDTIVLGRKTYDWVAKHGYNELYAEKETYIMTRQERPPQGNLTFYNGDLKTLITNLKAKEGKHIFCDGGAEIVHQLLSDKLVDEIIVSVIPILVGDGTRLFQNGRPEQRMELISVKSYDTELVQLHYKMKEDQ